MLSYQYTLPTQVKGRHAAHTLNSVASIVIDDMILAGKGEMFWRLFSCITLVDFGGAEIDQSALVRYLSEACYYPTALLPSHRLMWNAIDEKHAKATLIHGNHKVSGVFEFNEQGQIVAMCSEDRCR